MRFLRLVVAWIVGALLCLWRLSCRRQLPEPATDPRPALRAAGRPYVMALLHAHQLAAVMLNDEPRLAAMVSRSADGDLLVPALRLRRVLPVRGSSRRRGRDKGGLSALTALAGWIRAGVPALIAVDGPSGPRGVVHRGIIHLARDSGALILPAAALASRRWLLHRTWDRMQIPCPFAALSLHFGQPIDPSGVDDVVVRAALSRALAQLDQA